VIASERDRWVTGRAIGGGDSASSARRPGFALLGRRRDRTPVTAGNDRAKLGHAQADTDTGRVRPSKRKKRPMPSTRNPVRAIREKLNRRRRNRAERILRRREGQALHRKHSTFGEDSIGPKGRKIGD
jgi:hypothetical protein